MATDTDTKFPGKLWAKGLVLQGSGKILSMPDGQIGDSDIEAAAEIAVSKLNHLHRERYVQPNTAATTYTGVIHQAIGAGTVLSVSVGNIVQAIGDATVTVDLKKNGTTVLSGVVTANSTTPIAYDTVTGTISVPTYVAEDIFTIVVTATIGTGTLPTGLFVTVEFDEVYA